MGETFTLQETMRYGIIKALHKKKMTNNEAALAMGCSKRQVQRIKDAWSSTVRPAFAMATKDERRPMLFLLN